MTMIQPSTLEGSRTGRVTRLLCGVAFYVVFFVTFLYAIGFVEGLLVPEAIDTGTDVPRRRGTLGRCAGDHGLHLRRHLSRGTLRFK